MQANKEKNENGHPILNVSILILTMVLCFMMGCSSNFEKGSVAFEHGNYAEALQEW